MNLGLLFQLNRQSRIPLQTQLFESFRVAILEGRLATGTKLPSTRRVANDLGISRNTVLGAYARLTAEGYIEAFGASGTKVSADLPVDLEDPVRTTTKRKAPSDRPAPRKTRSLNPVKLWYGASRPEAFPERHWRRAMTHALRQMPNLASSTPTAAGLERLRRAIATHLLPARGLEVPWQNVFVTSGLRQSLALALHAAPKRLSQVAVETPFYKPAYEFLHMSGVQVKGVPVDSDGVCVEEIEQIHTKSVFVTPSHQFPTGGTLSLSRRLALLSWAREQNALILEDDFDSEFRYTGRPLLALGALDKNREHTIYLGTFSKALGPGFRLAYVTVPDRDVRTFERAAKQLGDGFSPLEQCALAQLIEEGDFARHVRKYRKALVPVRDTLVEGFGSAFGNDHIFGHDAGMHLVARLPEHYGKPAKFLAEMERRGVSLFPVSRSNVVVLPPARLHDVRRDLIVGYGGVSLEDAKRAVSVLKTISQDS